MMADAGHEPWSFSNSEALRAHQRPLGPFGPREMLTTLAFCWGFLVSPKCFTVKILFLQTPKLKWSNSSEFRSTKILINWWPWYQFLAVDLWHLWSWKFGVDFSYPSTSGLVHLGPCSRGIGVVDLCPLRRICHQLPQRGNHKRFWGNKVRYSSCMSLLGCSWDSRMLFESI